MAGHSLDCLGLVECRRQVMRNERLYPAAFLFLCGVILVPVAVTAQRTAAPAPAKEASPLLRPVKPSELPKAHRFWDRTNLWLFAGVGAARGLDYASTRNFRRRGRNEALLTNDIVDNAPLFASIEAAGVAASVGVSYWLHRTGHHKLERGVSIVHIGGGATGAAINFALKSVHRPMAAP